MKEFAPGPMKSLSRKCAPTPPEARLLGAGDFLPFSVSPGVEQRC
ncbi:hypothetical protein SAMN00790413_03671 [Deinococcus hopiensis KR-140]|uniref:Uncharacterized protein n=1 Tax=Deinococcus hopiensis KR-140 TaxID=695939 RepID=A0A1W1UZD0_9DEIO|nr:hypothetical protein SAMN00790413_03671 [Deinococcus hopiensis KR-140]